MAAFGLITLKAVSLVLLVLVLSVATGAQELGTPMAPSPAPAMENGAGGVSQAAACAVALASILLCWSIN
ncbi:hypothetical protein Cni_G02542 [Canna indica]|uniref:Uncharacterized protein n=1 Tax=Canna indica TaxID=4628 RepID=A0AAQ3JQA9_9LILI|nr:hypothetical protein Cni_G02542 [Canna indica]